MNELTTLEIIAPTVEEAISQGLAQLGLTADAVSIEVLDSGSKGLFGLGGRQVRVRLTVNPPPAPKAETPAPAPKPAASPKEKEPRPQKEKPAKPAPTPAAKKEAKPAPQETPAPKKKDAIAEPDSVLDAAESVVSKLIHYMGMKAQVSAQYDESSSHDRRIIHVEVRGDDLTALIGKRAETLNAFQYIASLIVGKQTGLWVQLNVDVEGYRSRREKQVKQLALRMAEQVVKTGRRAVLEPMSASERRAIHIELRNHPAVTTESTGEEPYRKVVISPKK